MLLYFIMSKSKEKAPSYQSDLLLGGRAGKILKTADYGVDGMHDSNLFDQNEDAAGERIDPANGIPYDNSTMIDKSHLQTKGLGYEITSDDSSGDVMGELPQEFDAAAQWLLHHDQPEHDHGHLSDVA